MINAAYACGFPDTLNSYRDLLSVSHLLIIFAIGNGKPDKSRRPDQSLEGGHTGPPLQKLKMVVKTFKPNLLFVFAHPDDDAFGPSGTLIMMSKDYDIHFLCVTKGQSGENHSNNTSESLSKIREREVRASSKIIGANSIKFLDFVDGELCNNSYHDITAAIRRHVDLLQPSILMTFEPRGVTGHIDHIVVSMACHFVYQQSPYVNKLMLYCLNKYQASHFLEGYFIYRPPGYDPKDIDLVVDVSSVWDKKIEAIKCHKSQSKDFQKIMNRPKIRLMEDCFQVLEKDKSKK